MLSFKKGIPIAVVKGGPRDKQILRLYSGSIDDEQTTINKLETDEELLKKIKNPLVRLPVYFFDDYKKLTFKDIESIKQNIKSLKEPEDEYFLTIYNKAIKLIIRSLKKEIILKDGKFEALPSKDIVERIYVTAPSGAGKSTWISNWLSKSRKLWKKKKDRKDIFIFSRVQQDRPLDKFKPTRIDIDEELLADPVQAEDLDDSITIFDDIDTISDAALKKVVTGLRDDLLECGRHYNVRMLMTSHLMMDGMATKKCLNESTSVIFFARGGNTYQIRRFLQLYCGFEKDVINKILALPSRWVMIRKLYPMMVLSERHAFVVV